MRTFSRLKEEHARVNEELDRFGSELIIVEGKKDVEALCELGVENSMLPINSRPLYQVVEAAQRYRHVMILSDLDKEGKRIYRYLYHYLGQSGVKVNNRFRLFLFRETPVRKIENLAAYMRNMEECLFGERIVDGY